MGTPDITVVMASFNRGDGVRRSIASVLDQTHPDVELVVADASTDGRTPDVLRSIDDPRLTVLFVDNLGMPVARNQALELASGRWLAYLDDDDLLLPDWAETMLGAVAGDERCGLVVAGHDQVDPDTGAHTPIHAGPGHLVPNGFIAGGFLAPTEAIRETGGMLEGLPAGHHWDMGVRLVSWCRDHGRSVVYVDRTVAHIETRQTTDRALSSPRQIYDGKRWVRVRHDRALVDDATARATNARNIGVPAFRLGLRSDAIRWFALAVREEPRARQTWTRFATVLVTPLARRVWGDERDYAEDPTATRRGLPVVGMVADARGTTPDLLMLPYGYREADPSTLQAATAGAGAGDRAARAAGRAALAREVKRRGAGGGPEPQVLLVDVDQQRVPVAWRIDRVEGDVDRPTEEATALAEVSSDAVDVVLLAGTLEQADDPYAVLREVRRVLVPGGSVVVAAQNRDAVEGVHHLGPPSAGWPRRQWSSDELPLVLEAADLVVTSTRPASPRAARSKVPNGPIVIVAHRR